MRTSIIFLVSIALTILTFGAAIVAALVFRSRDPLPWFIIACLSFPFWLMMTIFLTKKMTGTVDVLYLQNYSNIARIKQNTEKTW